MRFALSFLVLLAPSLVAAQGFDPKDAAKTAEWVMKESQPIKDAVENQNVLARAVAEKKFSEKLAALRGKVVDWKVTGASMDPIYEPSKSRGPKKVIGAAINIAATSAVAADGKAGLKIGYDVLFRSPAGQAFPVPSDEWVLKYRADTPLRLQGKIAGIRFMTDAPQGGSSYQIVVTFAGYQLTPAPAEKKADKD